MKQEGEFQMFDRMKLRKKQFAVRVHILRSVVSVHVQCTVDVLEPTVSLPLCELL